MSVATCKHCGETIMTPAMETYYIHTRTGMAQCGIRYATPINPTADETKDPATWTRLDLDAFWEGLNGIEPIGAMSEPESGGEVDKTLSNVTEEPLIHSEVIKGSTTDQISCDTEQTEIQNEHSNISASATSDVLPEYECDHLWLTKAGTAYRFKFVELCAKCGEER